MPVRVSSIIIAKDEERNIGRCIESQLNCIDEIVVLVDEETKDRTAEIAASYEKVIMIFTEWEGYAGTKKKALEFTTGDWILWIDADEALSPELCGEIQKFKNEEETEEAAFKIARRAFFLGKWIKHGGWYPGYVTRLFKKDKARFNENAVHEGLEVDGKIGLLKNDIYHYTDPDIYHYFKKFNNYTSLAAEELRKKGRKFSVSDILLRPSFLFVKMFILKRGFLDGLQGFTLAVFSSVYVFTKYLKLWELEKGFKNETGNHSEH